MSQYPQGDSQFEDVHIVKVTRQGENGWSIECGDGWSFFVPASSPIVPEPGMPARFYGRGIGATVRGLFLCGTQVFYRTEAEDKEHQEIQSYGIDAADWLARWDAGKTVWSIEMGGLGPGYEQCIQITAAEVLRWLLANRPEPDSWSDETAWQRDRTAMEKVLFANPAIERLGLSGAQWGAAVNIATMLYHKGPRAVMADERVKDRHIQVRRDFP